MASLLSRLPKAARYFLAVEFSERASYYGYRSLLTRFLTTTAGLIGHKNFTEEEANAITHQNIAITYIMPLVGGLLADWFLGKYLTIVGFALICCTGHLLLALSFHFEEMQWLGAVFSDALSVFQTGLVAIAIGAGGLKPNNSGLYGDQFQGPYQPMIATAYQWFYTAINVGSLLSFIVIPPIAKGISYDWGFGVPGLLMAASTAMLVYAKKTFTHVPPTGGKVNNFITLNIRALWLRLNGVRAVWTTLAVKVNPDAVEGVKALWRVIGYFSWFIILWGIYDMNGSEWVNDARYLDRRAMGWAQPIPEESIQTVNALFIILLVPFSLWFFQWLKERYHLEVTTREKVFWGMLLVTAAALMEGAIRTGIDQYLISVQPQVDQFIALDPSKNTAGGFFKAHPEMYSNIPVLWQVLAYFVLTSGEILFSIGGLELGYRYAPPSMKSSVLAIWYLSTAVGNLVVSMVSSQMGEGQLFHFLMGANYYWFFAGLLVVNAAFYKFFLPRMKEKLYV